MLHQQTSSHHLGPLRCQSRLHARLELRLRRVGRTLRSTEVAADACVDGQQCAGWTTCLLDFGVWKESWSKVYQKLLPLASDTASICQSTSCLLRHGIKPVAKTSLWIVTNGVVLILEIADYCWHKGGSSNYGPMLFSTLNCTFSCQKRLLYSVVHWRVHFQAFWRRILKAVSKCAWNSTKCIPIITNYPHIADWWATLSDLTWQSKTTVMNSSSNSNSTTNNNNSKNNKNSKKNSNKNQIDDNDINSKRKAEKEVKNNEKLRIQ